MKCFKVGFGLSYALKHFFCYKRDIEHRPSQVLKMSGVWCSLTIKCTRKYLAAIIQNRSRQAETKNRYINYSGGCIRLCLGLFAMLKGCI